MFRKYVRKAKFVSWSVNDLAEHKGVSVATIRLDRRLGKFDPKDVASVVRYLCITRSPDFNVEVKLIRKKPVGSR